MRFWMMHWGAQCPKPSLVWSCDYNMAAGLDACLKRSPACKFISVRTTFASLRQPQCSRRILESRKPRSRLFALWLQYFVVVRELQVGLLVIHKALAAPAAAEVAAATAAAAVIMVLVLG